MVRPPCINAWGASDALWKIWLKLSYKSLIHYQGSKILSFLPCALRQSFDKNQNLDKQINFFHIQIASQRISKEFPKNSQRNPPKKYSIHYIVLKDRKPFKLVYEWMTQGFCNQFFEKLRLVLSFYNKFFLLGRV